MSPEWRPGGALRGGDGLDRGEEIPRPEGSCRKGQHSRTSGLGEMESCVGSRATFWPRCPQEKSLCGKMLNLFLDKLSGEIAA